MQLSINYQLQTNSTAKICILSKFYRDSLARNIINQVAHSFLTGLATLLTVLSLVPLNQLLTSSVFSLSLQLKHDKLITTFSIWLTLSYLN